MSTTYPLTLLYDAACPVCALEMDHLRARNQARQLVFINIADPDFDPHRFGATLAEMNAQIHAITADGRLLKGIEVLRLAYAAVGLGWLWQPTRWPLLQPLFDAAYRGFAKHRMTISRWAGPVIVSIRAWRARRRADLLARQMQACGNRREGSCVGPGSNSDQAPPKPGHLQASERDQSIV